MFIVVYNDDDCLCLPMQWDSDCKGALCVCGTGDIVVFSDRKAARRAIDISSKFAALCKAQGKPANEDFLGDCRKHVRIMPCVASTEARGTASPAVGGSTCA
jgi:hypothetical protein